MARMMKPWERLEDLVASESSEQVLSFLDNLGAAETARTISRLDAEYQSRLFTLLGPAESADVMEDIPDAQAADLIEELPPARAAAILEELNSDHLADVLAEVDDDRAEAILGEMDREDADAARLLLKYDPESAGGLMLSEFLAFGSDRTIGEVVEDLRANRETYADYNVQYLYVMDDTKRLVGVLRMHDLLFYESKTLVREVMLKDPIKVFADAPLEELREFFAEHKFFGVPVVDEAERMVGVVLPRAVEEASRARTVHQFLGLSGIVGGEEFRTMPLFLRSGRRLSWLSMNIVLNILAASVIAILNLPKTPDDYARTRSSLAYRLFVAALIIFPLGMIINVIAVMPEGVPGSLYASTLIGMVKVAAMMGGTYLLLPFGLIDLIVGPLRPPAET